MFNSNSRFRKARSRLARTGAIALSAAVASACVSDRHDADAGIDVTLADATRDAPAIDAVADAPAPSQCPLAIDHAEDIGPLAMPAFILGRDGGHSLAIAGRLLWTFGDTFLSGHAADGETVRSATAAWGGYADPLAIVEPLDAVGAPLQLIPYTDAEAEANRTDPQNGWALWAGSAVDDGSGDAMVIFQTIRRIAGGGFPSQGVGVAHVHPYATAATRDPGLLFAPPEPLFGASGAFNDGEYVYLMACETIGFFNVGCRLARAPQREASRRASYRYFDGAQWSSDLSSSTIFIDHAGGMSVSFNAHLGCYLGVHNQPLSSTIVLRTARRPEGPWSGPLATISDPTVVLPPLQDGYDYGAKEHPALATANGQDIVLGYSRPLTPFRGEVRLIRVRLR